MINLCWRRTQDTGLVEERRGRLQGRVSGGHGTWLSFAKNRCEAVQKSGVWVHALRSLSVSLKKETLTKTSKCTHSPHLSAISLSHYPSQTHYRHTGRDKKLHKHVQGTAQCTRILLTESCSYKTKVLVRTESRRGGPWRLGICGDGALDAGIAALLKTGRRVWREVQGAVVEEGEEGTLESIYSSCFAVEETEVRSRKVKCLKSHCT